jgi:Protein of unknown function (DUF2009)
VTLQQVIAPPRKDPAACDCLCDASQVDILNWKSKGQRVNAQIKDLCAILSGLVVAQDYKEGQKLIANRNFKENALFFQV